VRTAFNDEDPESSKHVAGGKFIFKKFVFDGCLLIAFFIVQHANGCIIYIGVLISPYPDLFPDVFLDGENNSFDASLVIYRVPRRKGQYSGRS
jgi:hypothetical protein